MSQEESTYPSPSDRTKFVLNQGALIGLALVAVSVLFYLLDMSTSSVASWVTYVVYASLLWWSITKYRDEMNAGFSTYGQALASGVRFALYGSIILGFYNYIFIGFIDSSIIDVALEQTYNSLLESGISEEEADKTLQQAETYMTPWFFGISTVFSTLLFGFLFSLVIAFFAKREAPNNVIFEEEQENE